MSSAIAIAAAMHISSWTTALAAFEDLTLGRGPLVAAW